ncbi:hypothetical protein [Raineyella fluvialis]|uniref:hypothetical protein n=1 Tax=Raineyella fluvialis TaxID=2662261 RepID=UPI001E2CA558|nr:hypothetical protein [Raineyella fluvialis]
MFRRHPHRRPDPGITKDYPLTDDAVLQVDVYDDAERWLVEIALCNEAQIVGRIR